MKTVGEILKNARAEQNISIASVAAQTKIQIKYLRALEENDFKKLPSAAFVKGFIRNYAQVVNKNPTSLLAIFRRDYDQDQSGQIIPRSLSSTPSSRWRWTPTATLAAGLALVLTLFFAYLIFQLKLLSRAPKLELTSPQDNQQVTRNVQVIGQSDPDATILINNKPVVLNQQGKFSDTILLPSGNHTITIKAQARNGKTKIIQRTVTVAQ